MNSPQVINYLKNIFIRFFQKKYIYDGYGDWDSAKYATSGYDSGEIIRKVDDAASLAKAGFVSYERDGVTFDDSKLNWHLLTALFLARESKNNMNILDFGGSLGSAYFQHKQFLDLISNYSWGVVEQDRFYKIGKSKYQDANLIFYKNIDVYLTKVSPNLVVLGSSLQYIQEFDELLNKISNSKAKVLLIDRTPFSKLNNHILAIQKIPRTIYDGSYPIRIFSLALFKKSLKKNWKILSIYDAIGAPTYTRNGVRVEWKGILCIKKN